MGLFLLSKYMGKKRDDEIADAYAERQKEIAEAERLADFMTTEGEGIAQAGNVDLSLDDDDEERMGVINNSISSSRSGGLYL